MNFPQTNPVMATDPLITPLYPPLANTTKSIRYMKELGMSLYPPLPHPHISLQYSFPSNIYATVVIFPTSNPSSVLFLSPWRWKWRPSSSSSSPISDIAISRCLCCPIHHIFHGQNHTNMIADQRGRNQCLQHLGKISETQSIHPPIYLSAILQLIIQKSFIERYKLSSSKFLTILVLGQGCSIYGN